MNRNDPNYQNDIQESRKEHGSLQELPCSPIKEREEVMTAMEITMKMIRKAILIVVVMVLESILMMPHENDVLQVAQRGSGSQRHRPSSRIRWSH